MRNFSDKSCRENQNTHFVFSNFFPASLAMSDNVEIYGRVRQPIDDPIIRCMRIAFWITKARIQTYLCILYLLFFHGNNGYANAPHSYVMRTLPVLFVYKTIFINIFVFASP